MSLPATPPNYGAFLENIKARIQAARTQAALAVSRELLALYWSIGRDIVARQDREGWGAGIIVRLAHDLQVAFPGAEGYSERNLRRIKAFYLAWRQEEEIRPQLVAELEGATADLTLPSYVPVVPWGHHAVLLEKLKDMRARAWYAAKSLEHGWSRAVLSLQIDSDTFGRIGRAATNFAQVLPHPDSDLAQQVLKDPYNFDFLTLTEPVQERALEQGLMDHIQRFLLELGVGFAFVGRQVRLTVGERDHYLDLLFYHYRLRCFVVIELKVVPFDPAFAGTLNFYLSAVDSQLRHPDDKPSIGLLLCRSKDRLEVEYALRDIGKPIGVADWEAKLVASVPEGMVGSLPTVEELERELGRVGEEEE